MPHPSVIADLDERIADINSAILSLAASYEFSYSIVSELFEPYRKTPDVIYAISEHFTQRGFLVTYDGTTGEMVFSWDYPNMTWSDARKITRAKPELIPTLGSGFTAALLYLCMTNGVDLRKQTPRMLARQLDSMIREAALNGLKHVEFGNRDVPEEAFANLYSEVFTNLLESGLDVDFNDQSNMFRVTWGETFNAAAASGNIATLVLEV